VLSESELNAAMGQLAQGDRKAFDPLFRSLYPRALRLARVRLSDADAAEAAQNALMKVFAKASSFVPGKPMLPWFYAIAATEVHMVSRERAKQRMRTEPAPDIELSSSEPDPERQLEKHELEKAMDLAIHELDPASADAILAALGRAPRPDISRAAYRKRVSRAYERLRLVLRGFYA
jgi:RNA polymerase sigma-70 factor (ECF subfamily)